ncbi:hypothetical protein [Cellulomonas denverensis]|uniref:Uncharacterized protein n=1 Tax=Cellulomonas denverensis TaxID=264297 RepID=A0A7X6KTF6_9CELL|nr:hypothetical protein [Cellulomonas denverensis]NKY21976.1 hypothetical protein [Cellulomonas denverensis]GIG24131.1 hypothetical protein Cde04nite_03750 [Cellulomonas denverensis]
MYVPRSSRWSAALGVLAIAVQLLALPLLVLVRGQMRYGMAVALVTAGVLAGVGAIACGLWFLQQRRRRVRAGRRTSRGRGGALVCTGICTGTVAAGWLIPVVALGLGTVSAGL